MKWTEVISNWLKEGEDGADNLIEYPWDIDIKELEGSPERDLIIASHPKIPFNIEVVVSKHFTNLMINPVIPTDAIPAEERMRLYKKLLHLNTDLNLMKAGLVGYDDSPVIQVDLDLESISKQEFNNAMTLLVIGAQNLVNVLGLEEKVQDFMMDRFRQIITIKMAGGESKDDILDFLMNRGGLEEEIANRLFDQINAILTKKEEENGDSSSSDYEGPMYG